jgi:hypothetical protein
MHPAALLLSVLQNAILPALKRDARTHFGVTQTRRKQLILPPEVRAVPLKNRGRRVCIKLVPQPKPIHKWQSRVKF